MMASFDAHTAVMSARILRKALLLISRNFAAMELTAQTL